jgi:hypothetical protein
LEHLLRERLVRWHLRQAALERLLLLPVGLEHLLLELSVRWLLLPAALELRRVGLEHPVGLLLVHLEQQLVDSGHLQLVGLERLLQRLVGLEHLLLLRVGLERLLLERSGLRHLRSAALELLLLLRVGLEHLLLERLVRWHLQPAALGRRRWQELGYLEQLAKQ